MGKAGFQNSKGNISSASSFTDDNRILRTDTASSPTSIQQSGAFLGDDGTVIFPTANFTHMFFIDATLDSVSINQENIQYSRSESGTPTTQTAKFFVMREDANNRPGFIGAHSGDGASRAFTMTYLRSRGTWDSPTAVADGDTIGEYFFEAYDGANYIRGGVLNSIVQGTPSSNAMPLAFVFETTDVNIPLERARYHPDGTYTYGQVYTNPIIQFNTDGSAIFNQRNDSTGDLQARSANVDNMLFIDASEDCVAIGGSTATTTIAGTTYKDRLSVQLTGNTDRNSLVLYRRSSTGSPQRPPRLYGKRARGAGASDVQVQDNDCLLDITGLGFDGTDYGKAATILFEVDADTGAGDMPGRITFLTSADGSETPAEALRIDSLQSTIASGRVQEAKGTDVASGSLLTLDTDGNFFDVTGTTTIDYIAGTDWQAGSIVTLSFDDAVTVKHNTSALNGTTKPFLLAGSVDFSATADDNLTVRYDGTKWREIARTVI